MRACVCVGGGRVDLFVCAYFYLLKICLYNFIPLNVDFIVACCSAIFVDMYVNRFILNAYSRLGVHV